MLLLRCCVIYENITLYGEILFIYTIFVPMSGPTVGHWIFGTNSSFRVE